MYKIGRDYEKNQVLTAQLKSNQLSSVKSQMNKFFDTFIQLLI